MLHWKVCWTKGPPPEECDCVRHRKRKPRRDIAGIALIVAAALLLICIVPFWVLLVVACAVLVALGVLWLCT